LSSSIVEQLAGRFALLRPPTSQSGDGSIPVDVKTTNGHLVLHGQRLEVFTAVPANDGRVLQIEDVLAQSTPIDARKLVLLLLCGGLSFRSEGKVHPLRTVKDPGTGQECTLLDRQLNRLASSPLGPASCVIVGTPLNEDALRNHLQKNQSLKQPRLLVGGMAPRLLPVQKATGPPMVYRDASRQISYNPLGHLEALRWLVLSGMLAHFVEHKVILSVSYSNWGPIFSETTAAVAGFVAANAQSHPDTLFFVEVTPRSKETQSGSFLVAPIDRLEPMHLVKYIYGQGAFAVPPGDGVLVSTNTIYFSVQNLMSRLQGAAATTSLSDSRGALIQLLWDAAARRRRDQLANLFDVAFPVEPHLIPDRGDGSALFLRVERDLDQLSLIPGSTLMQAVEVPANRGVFLKLPSDFDDPNKRTFLFAS